MGSESMPWLRPFWPRHSPPQCLLIQSSKVRSSRAYRSDALAKFERSSSRSAFYSPMRPASLPGMFSPSMEVGRRSEPAESLSSFRRRSDRHSSSAQRASASAVGLTHDCEHLKPDRRVLHVLTNSRALPAVDAEALVLDAAEAIRAVITDAEIILRGDSTLRGHLLEEYRAVWRARKEPRAPVLLLVPALPGAGRVTRGRPLPGARRGGGPAAPD